MVKYQSICVDFVNKTKPALKTIGTTVKKSQIFEDSLNTLIEIKSLKTKVKTFLGLLYKDAEQNAFYLGLKFLEKVSPA